MYLEDDSIDVISIRRMFKKNQITNSLYVAEDGLEALSILRELSISSHVITEEMVMLLNFYTLHDKGIKLLEELLYNTRFQEIPVIFILTADEKKNRLQTYNFNIIGYLSKPITFSEIAKIVRLKVHNSVVS
ncbi:MAG: response regulator [Chlorogloea purpurea SAG 13.99]|nr:response regulator [Chlorogloea purpurea SAG 13.99]